MDFINSYQPNTHGKWDFNAFGDSYSGRQLTRVTESHQEDKDITIFTEDGDRVTITSNHQSQASYSKYAAVTHQSNYADFGNMAVVQNKYTLFQDERFEFENSRNFSISVDGDLNAQELKDIRKTISAIDNIMTDILNGGDLTQGVVKAIQLVDLDSISGISANYRYENATSVEMMEAEEVSTYNRAGQIEQLLPGFSKEAEYIKNLIDEMINIIKDTAVKPSKIIKPLRMLFSEILGKLSSNARQDQSKIDLAKLIETMLIEKIEQMNEQAKFPLNPSSPDLT
jgi:hypothetical protein